MKSDGFDIFLSYNSSDLQYATEIAEALTREGLKVWFDRWELRPGVPWQEEMERVYATAQTTLLLIGGDSVGPWQKREVHALLSAFVERGARLIPVLLPGASDASMPLFLKQFTALRFEDWNRDALQTIVEVASPVKAIPRDKTPVPKVFLCHAKEDDDKIERLFYRLKDLGIEPWYDKESLTVGDRWEKEIIAAIQNTDFFAICLSVAAAKKRGFIQKEIRTAVKEYQRRPENLAFLLPVKIEDCDIPDIKLDRCPPWKCEARGG